MQRGGQAADVWVVSGEPGRARDAAAGRSRRLQAQPAGQPAVARRREPDLARPLRRAGRRHGAHPARLSRAPGRDVRSRPAAARRHPRPTSKPLGIDTDVAIPPGLLRTIDNAVYSAGQIRDRFSPDGWLALRDLSKTVHKLAERVQPGDDATRAMTVMLRKLAGFSGLLHENMYRFTGWRFLEIGRRIERAIQIARTLAAGHRQGRARRRARHDAGDRRQRHDPPPPVHGAIRPPHRHRPARARPAQPALHPVPARAPQGRDRPSAAPRARPG